MYEEDFYEQFEPMPQQYNAIENLIKERCRDVAKDLVLEIEQCKSKIKSQSDLLQKYMSIERDLDRYKKEDEKKYKQFSKDCAMRYLSEEAGLNGVVYGDTVFVIDYKNNVSTCETCNGKGDILVRHNRSDLKIRCPNCGGTGKITKSVYFPVSAKVSGFSCLAKESRDNNEYFLKTELALVIGNSDRKSGRVIKKEASELNSKSYYSGWYKTEEDAFQYCEELTKQGVVA